MKIKLEELNYKIITADIEHIPQMIMEITDEQKEFVNKLYERLGKESEVERIYDNIA